MSAPAPRAGGGVCFVARGTLMRPESGGLALVRFLAVRACDETNAHLLPPLVPGTPGLSDGKLKLTVVFF